MYRGVDAISLPWCEINSLLETDISLLPVVTHVFSNRDN